METTQDRLNKELQKGKSIATWAIGYYVAVGNEYCPGLEGKTVFNKRKGVLAAFRNRCKMIVKVDLNES